MAREDIYEKRRKAQMETGGTADTDPKYAELFDYADEENDVSPTLYKNFANKSALSKENNPLHTDRDITKGENTPEPEQKNPYEDLFRRADERREQRRREAEALKPKETAEEIEARHEKLRKAAAVSDAILAIGNVLWTGRGSKPVYDPKQSMSEAARKRYAERMAVHDKQQQAWLRAREAYERGENSIENLRLRAMEYEDRRKAREAEAERKAADSKARQEAINIQNKWKELIGAANVANINARTERTNAAKVIDKEKGDAAVWKSYHSGSGGGRRGGSGGSKDYVQTVVKEDGYGGKTTTTTEKHYGTPKPAAKPQKKPTGVFNNSRGKGSQQKSTGIQYKKRPK